MSVENMGDHVEIQKEAKPTLRKLRGKPIDLSEMPDSAWVEEEKANFVRVAGIRLGEVGRVYDYLTGGLQLKLGDPVVVEVPERGLLMGWVAKAPIRLDVTGLNLRLKEIIRRANEGDLENHEKKVSMEARGYERTCAVVGRIGLDMSVLKVEYTLDRRKALVFFASESRVDFRGLLKELVHDLKAKVELRQVGARDQTKQIGGIGPCGEETCCSRFIDKFHGVSIKMAKDQGLSLKPAKVSGMCGRLKCCLAYEQQTYVEGSKTVPKVGRCVKSKSGCSGVVRDVDIPRQTCLVELDDGTMAVLPASEIFEEKTLSKKTKSTDEKMVATSDAEALKRQIEESGKESREES